METSADPIVTLTESAVRRVKEIIKEKNDPTLMLRVGVQGGGCSGLSYSLTFDSKAGEHDTVYEVDGLKVAVDAKSALYLYGTQLDFSNDLMNGGFRFINPNAKRSCGCGESFSA
jgi:iron-sulfur cluster assembly protein